MYTRTLGRADLASGEVATGAQQPAFQMMTTFLGLMLDPFVDGRSGIGGVGGGAIGFAPEREELPEDIVLAYSKVLRTPVYKGSLFEQRWSIWGAGYGGYNRTSGDPVVIGSHDLTARIAGGAAGLDYRIAPSTVVGFALAGGGTGWSLAQGLGSGSSDAFQAGVYAKTYSGPFYLASALAYTQHWMSTDRIICWRPAPGQLQRRELRWACRGGLSHPRCPWRDYALRRRAGAELSYADLQ